MLRCYYRTSGTGRSGMTIVSQRYICYRKTQGIVGPIHLMTNCQARSKQDEVTPLSCAASDPFKGLE